MKTQAAQVTRRQLLMGAGGMTLAVAVPGASLAALRPLADSAPVQPITWADFAGCPLLDGANPFWVQAAEEIMAEPATRVDGFR